MTGPGSETGGFTYDAEETSVALEQMTMARPMAVLAAHLFDRVSVSQTERRWGVEEGAVTFRKTYEQSMGALHHEFRAMDERLADFVAALTDAKRALDDADNAAAEEIIKTRLRISPQEDQQVSNEETEWSPGPYTDSSGVEPINKES